MTIEWTYVIMRVIMIALMTYVLAIRRTLLKPQIGGSELS
jgi:hypothetical protein